MSHSLKILHNDNIFAIKLANILFFTQSSATFKLQIVCVTCSLRLALLQ